MPMETGLEARLELELELEIFRFVCFLGGYDSHLLYGYWAYRQTEEFAIVRYHDAWIKGRVTRSMEYLRLSWSWKSSASYVLWSGIIVVCHRIIGYMVKLKTLPLSGSAVPG